MYLAGQAGARTPLLLRPHPLSLPTQPSDSLPMARQVDRSQRECQFSQKFRKPGGTKRNFLSPILSTAAAGRGFAKHHKDLGVCNPQLPAAVVNPAAKLRGNRREAAWTQEFCRPVRCSDCGPAAAAGTALGVIAG